MLQPSFTPTIHPTFTHTPIPPSATATSIPPPATPVVIFTVHYHPDGGLFIGDQVSLEVIPPGGWNSSSGIDLKDKKIQVQVDEPIQTNLGLATFSAYGIGGRLQATLTWAWDTRGLEPGNYTLHFSIQPDGASWYETISLKPADDLRPPEPQAHWEMTETGCCAIYYITGTAAERDLASLAVTADEQANMASQRMGIELSSPITITILPRVIGHGGLADSEVYVSYLDRNYAGNDFAMVVQHEMIHVLDSRLGGDLRPTILVEGLAVYMSGGHFKPEPLLPRAAALTELGWYLPLAPLSDDFYTSQHEIGYLEAGALVQYLVNTYGWQTFSAFYRDIHPQPSGKQSDALDVALNAHFELGLAQLEERFLAELQRQSTFSSFEEDVRLTVTYYNTVRRYQQILDPSAYFLMAWIPNGKMMRERGIVADYLRHPDSPENKSLETWLVEVGHALLTGNFGDGLRTLRVVNIELDTIQQKQNSFPQGMIVNLRESFELFYLRTSWQEWQYITPQVMRIDVP